MKWKNEFIGKKKRKNAQERHQNQFGRSNQPPIGRSRKLGFQREFHVPAFQRNCDSTCLRPKRTEIALSCAQKERRFHFAASKLNWDSTGKFPKVTEIALPCVQKELRFHLPTSKKNFYSTCPPPKSTETPTTHVPKRKKSSLQLGEPSPTLVKCQNPQKTFWVATRVLLFFCPRKKRFSFSFKKKKTSFANFDTYITGLLWINWP